MKTNINIMKQSTDIVGGIAQLLSGFDDKREGLTWIYLLSITDDEGRVKSSINAMAQQLNTHRQALTRIINRLCEKGYAAWARNDKTFMHNHNSHDKTPRPTAAELIADAQRTAIEETERFIREAEIRRGGIPPHLPF